MLIDRDNYLTVDEYRRMINYSSCGAIRMAIKTGRLDAVKVGRDWLIRKSAILQTNRTGQYATLKREREQRKRDMELGE